MTQVLTIALHTLGSIADFLFTADPIERRLRDSASRAERMRVMNHYE